MGKAKDDGRISPQWAFYVGYRLLGTFGNTDIVVAARYANGVPPNDKERGSDAPLCIEPVAIALYAAFVFLYVLAFRAESQSKRPHPV
jgi:hypothetical protein